MTAIGAITRLPELRECSPIQHGGIRHVSLPCRHNDHDSVSNHQPHGCLLNRLFRRRSKKTSKFRVTGLCVGNSPGPVNSPHKGPVTRKMFPFDDVIMYSQGGMIFPTKKNAKMYQYIGILCTSRTSHDQYTTSISRDGQTMTSPMKLHLYSIFEGKYVPMTMLVKDHS